MTLNTTQHAATIRNLLSRAAKMYSQHGEGIVLMADEIASLEHAAKILGLTERPQEKEGN